MRGHLRRHRVVQRRDDDDDVREPRPGRMRGRWSGRWARRGGGGSSVPLFAWDANATLTNTTLQAGAGGNGAPGGTPGAVGHGSAGAAGASEPPGGCPTVCSGLLGSCKMTTNVIGDGGTPGGTGGSGGKAGAGGDGAGGDSFAYVEGGNATVSPDTFTKAHYVVRDCGDHARGRQRRARTRRGSGALRGVRA